MDKTSILGRQKGPLSAGMVLADALSSGTPNFRSRATGDVRTPHSWFPLITPSQAPAFRRAFILLQAGRPKLSGQLLENT